MYHNIPIDSEFTGSIFNKYPLWKTSDGENLMVAPSLEVNSDRISNKNRQIVEMAPDTIPDRNLSPNMRAFSEAVKQRGVIPIDERAAVMASNGKIKLIPHSDWTNQQKRRRWFVADEKAAKEIGNDVLKRETVARFPELKGKGRHNNKGDAWRHARWNERMVKEINWLTAVVAGYANELGSIERHVKDYRIDEDLVDWEKLFQEILMDLHNNSEGRSGKSADELLEQGRLNTIDPPYRGKGGLY